MMRVLVALVVSLFTLTLSGCGSRAVRPWLAQNNLGDDGAMVLWTKLDDQGELKGRYSCTLIMGSHLGHELRLPLKAGMSRHILVASPGTYSFKALECGMFTDFGLEVAPRFAIVAGHFSWIGHLELSLTDRKNLKWSMVNPEAQQSKLDYLALPEEVRRELITGYSATMMNADFFKEQNDNIKAESHNLSRTLDPKVITFEGCFKAEEEINPLKLGTITFTKQGMGPFEKSGAHGYTPTLVRCLEDGLKSLGNSYFNEKSSLTVSY